MRIVHEIHSSEVQIVLGPDAYVSAEGRPHRMKVDVCASVRLPLGGKDEAETLYFEGDGGYIVHVLRKIADLIEASGQEAVARGELDRTWLDV